MTYLDFVLAAVVGTFVMAGFWFGLIHTVGSLIGLVAGAVISGRLYETGAAWLSPYITNQNLAKFLAFVIIYLVVTKVIAILFWLFERTVKVLAIIPFFRTFDRLFGAIFGLLEGTFLVGLSVWFVARFPFSSAFADTMTSSALVGKFYVVGSALSVLLPGALKSLQSIL
jgi:uncharacterized membrane protein required for colicin V production